MSSKYAVGSILKEAYILVLVESVNRRAHVSGASEVLEEDRPREEWIVAVDAFSDCIEVGASSRANQPMARRRSRKCPDLRLRANAIQTPTARSAAGNCGHRARY
jgi:hypothetical protein